MFIQCQGYYGCKQHESEEDMDCCKPKYPREQVIIMIITTKPIMFFDDLVELGSSYLANSN